MKDEPRYNYGTVDLELGGKLFKLRPTLTASDKIDREFGGIRGAAQKVTEMNLTAIARIVAIGVNTPSKKGEEKIKQLIHDAGRMTVAEKVADFLFKMNDPTGSMDDDNDETVDEEGNDQT